MDDKIRTFQIDLNDFLLDSVSVKSRRTKSYDIFTLNNSLQFELCSHKSSSFSLCVYVSVCLCVIHEKQANRD